MVPETLELLAFGLQEVVSAAQSHSAREKKSLVFTMGEANSGAGGIQWEDMGRVGRRK